MFSSLAFVIITDHSDLKRHSPISFTAHRVVTGIAFASFQQGSGPCAFPPNNDGHQERYVEGFEPSVMAGAKELLQARLIKNIFMEVSARTKPERDSNIDFLKYLSGPAGYNLYQIGGWQGPSKEVNWPQDDLLVEKILDATTAEQAKQLNLWWKVSKPTASRRRLR